MLLLIWFVLWLVTGQPAVVFNPINGWAISLIIVIILTLR